MSADRGESVLELAVLVPIALLLVLLGVQTAAYFHAANIAEHASSRGATTAARVGSSNSAGSAEAAATVHDSGSSLVGLTVSGGASIRATVTVAVSSIVPFFPSAVTRSASAPKERYVREDER